MHSETKPLPAVAPEPYRAKEYAARLLLPSYAATLFVSAGLLFLVQPMVTKMVLPRLGGSPAVWNTCMCFFQAVLLLGYAYAHVLSRRFGSLGQAAIHAAVLALATAFLPLDLTHEAPPAGGMPVWWLIGRLAVTVGPPFFALSATAPLLQRWFSRTDHATAADPYFLYAASNAGSLLALLAYPLLVEPNMPLSAQGSWWSAGLGLVTAGIALCWRGYRSCRAPGPAAAADSRSENRPRPALAARLRWVAYAFVPSSLLLAVTAHITTDLASAPLFWVIPLALYLATFILVFARRQLLPHRAMLKLQPFLIIPVVLLSAVTQSIWLLLLHLACFFVAAMVCHGELARHRPAVQSLTEFYLFVSLGGMLGGVFNALAAPVLFPGIWEYPLMLVAACLARPWPRYPGRSLAGDLASPAALFALLLALLLAGNLPGWVLLGTFPAAAIALLQFSQRPLRFALGVAACLAVMQLATVGDTLDMRRSFFGVYRVRLVAGGAIRVLQHGTTTHGAENTEPGRETVPLGYYSREGPFGRFFTALGGRGVTRVGVIGLGTGVLGCYARLGQSWTFHEIDPAVEAIARDPRFFDLLDRCGNDPRIVLGDARLTMEDVPDVGYDAIVIDAFSSDSIPVHLLTREAFALYRRKLASDGVILFHISNRYLDLAPVIAALAQDAGSPARQLLYLPPDPQSIEHLAAEVVAVGQPGRNLDFLTPQAGWQVPDPPPAAALWTDERSDIVSRIRW